MTGWLAAALVAGTICASTASAQQVEITGPLAGAPACIDCRMYREHRLSLKPFVGFTLQDEFSRAMLLGAELGFYFTDWLGLNVWGAFAPINVDTSLTDEVAARGQSTSRNRLSLPTAEGFPDQIGHINWAAGAEARFIPLRGKLALFQELFIDTDFSVFGGVALVGVEERAAFDASGSDLGPSCDEGVVGADPGRPLCQSQFERNSRVALAPTFGVALNLYATKWFGLSFSWRALPFSWNTSGTDEAGQDAQGGSGGDFPDGEIDSDDRIFHFNHMLVIGMIFYLPTETNYTTKD